MTGVFLGSVVPEVFRLFASIEYAGVNVPVAIFIWVMIFPMMVQVDFSSINGVGHRPKGLIITLVVNWLIKPFTMALLGWFFFRIVFVD